MDLEAGTRPVGPRRAELLAALSMAIDLGLGQPMEHMLRAALISTRLADRLDLGPDQRATVYYVSLVSWIGCHADSHEYARYFGDDIDTRAASYQVEWAGLPFLQLLVHRVGRGRPAPQRAWLVGDVLTRGRGDFVAMIRSHCTSAGLLATEVGLPADVTRALSNTFERWDGKGMPDGLRGADIAIEMRVAQLADVAEVWLRTHGVDACLDMVRSRRGRQFDPEVADAFLAERATWMELLALDDVWRATLEQDPDGDRVLAGDDLERIVTAVGDFADLKCPFTLGHSRGVAALAGQAAYQSGLGEDAAAQVRRAGHLHDLGRLGVSNAVWEKPGPLSSAEWERVRLHPYFTERILRRVRGLEPEAAIAAAHHERQDRSGYPQGLSGSALGPAQRLLAAADSFHTWLEPRPHRPPHTEAEAVQRLQDEARSGRLDPEAVEAVLAVTGRRARRRDLWPDGLTTREVEVLRLLALARSNRQIAEELVVSEKTVRNHVEHIYAKIGVTNRVGAGLYAVHAGLTREFPHPTG
ncbi:MAG: HD domain-containing protein [Intrasporangium sp.]|uniref:HD domain-containing phosphohydrolase n=1 Tax=Intrasporangium sp. TaxID=1925024 RepID=UPI0026470A90|nr:HD domain-containing phosphohydrolase [Intrasporangium sp.]MDN5797459.1 HD domain-containing protein [Intrasporangium sp.]